MGRDRMAEVEERITIIGKKYTVDLEAGQKY